MRRLLIAIGTLLALSIVFTSVAFAQGGPPQPTIDVAKLFVWLTTTPPNWAQGIFYAILGLVGALVILFSLVGGAVPGTAGKADIDANKELLKMWTEELNKLIKATPKQAADIDALGKQVNDLRDDLSRDMWRQFLLSGFLYAILGAFFATAFAQDPLQALLVGAGWTGLLGTLGLASDYAKRKAVKDEAIQALQTQLQTTAAASGAPAPPSVSADLLSKVRVALSL